MSVPKAYNRRPGFRGPLRPSRNPPRPVPVEEEPAEEKVAVAAPDPVVEPPAPEPEVVELAPEPEELEEVEPEEIEPEDLEEAAPVPDSDEVSWSMSMRKAELLALAHDKGLDVSDSNTKAEILDALDGTR